MRTISQSWRFKQTVILALLGGVSLLSIVSACLIGSVHLSLAELWQGFFGFANGPSTSLAQSLLSLRLERALSGFVTGASLAMAGVLMQALLRNPLADPYVLGISGGASVAALTALLFFAAAWTVDVTAFIGAIAVSALLFVLAYRDLRGHAISEGNASLLLLTGVIIASGCGAVITLMLSVAPDSRLRSMVFWLIGDLSNVQSRYLPWLFLLIIGALVLRSARAINVLAMAADNARTLGVNIGRLRYLMFICSALLTASAVSSAGSIGFVGLILPHACRFAFGSDHRVLIPAASLAGGSFLVLADTIARSIVAPQQLPVGVVTAVIGVPVFLWQLHRSRKHDGSGQ